MEFKGKEFESIDYFGQRCCVCEAETENEPNHDVFTGRYSREEQKTGFKEYTVSERAWGFKHHPCRVCDKCKRRNRIIAGVVLALAVAGTAAFYITQWDQIQAGATWQKYAPGVIGLLGGGLVWGQIDKRFGPEAIAKKKAASMRGAGYTGWDADDFSDVVKMMGS